MDRLKYEGSQHQRRGCVQWRIQGRCPGGPPPLFLDQTEARRAEKVSFVLRPGSSPPPPAYLRVWMTGLPPHLT